MACSNDVARKFQALNRMKLLVLVKELTLENYFGVSLCICAEHVDRLKQHATGFVQGVERVQ